MSIRVRTMKEMERRIVTEKLLDDGYIWRKYGEKEFLGSKYPRQYYRCTFRYIHGCLARKQVQRSTENPSVFEVAYHGNHTCPRKLHTNCSSLATESASTTVGIRDSSTSTEAASTVSDSHSHVATSPQELDSMNNFFQVNVLQPHFWMLEPGEGSPFESFVYGDLEDL